MIFCIVNRRRSNKTCLPAGRLGIVIAIRQGVTKTEKQMNGALTIVENFHSSSRLDME
jgi:hypothetical protein